MTAPALRIASEDDNLFNAEPVYHYPQITMRATVHHRGRDITVVAADMSADQFCDVLDKRFGPPAPNAPQPATAAPAVLATGEAPICPVHTDRRMKVSNYGGWFCTATNAITNEKCTQKVK